MKRYSHRLSRLLLALAAAIWLGGCQAAPTLPAATATMPAEAESPTSGASPVPSATATPSEMPTLTAMPVPSDTPVPTPLPTATLSDEERYAGWGTYRNETYGFSLRLPPGWTAEEDTRPVSTLRGHAVHLMPEGQSTIRLVVSFKYADEEQLITRTGVGSGELDERGSVPFLGEEVSRVVLVDRGKDMAVLYDGAGEIQRGDLVFALSLDYLGPSSDSVTLTEELQAQVDGIVASFERTS